MVFAYINAVENIGIVTIKVGPELVLNASASFENVGTERIRIRTESKGLENLVSKESEIVISRPNHRKMRISLSRIFTQNGWLFFEGRNYNRQRRMK